MSVFQVFDWAADLRAPTDALLDLVSNDGVLTPLQASTDLTTLGDLSGAPQVRLGHPPRFQVQRTLAMMTPWVDHMEPFILVGPEGYGRDMIIQVAFQQRQSTSITPAARRASQKPSEAQPRLGCLLL